MTEEQQNAIERLDKRLTIEKNTKNIGTPVYISDLKIALELIQKQQVELERKDKIINEMACTIYDYANLGKLKICDCELEDGKIALDLCEQTLADRNCLECIKRYFERKVEDAR